MTLTITEVALRDIVGEKLLDLELDDDVVDSVIDDIIDAIKDSQTGEE
jgi:hypothetical protein